MQFLSIRSARRPAPARALARLVGAAVLGVVLAGCAFVTGIPSVSRVEITVPVTVIAPGQSMQASGRAFGNNDNVITNSRRQVHFSSDHEDIATVNSVSGLITGVSPGHARITASSDNKSDYVDITVRPVPVRQVIITNRAPVLRLAPSAILVLSASVIDTNNQVLSNRPPTWTSSNPAVATITAVGAVTPVAVGTTQITASVDTGLAPNVGQVADTVTLKVTLVPVSSIQITPTQAVTLYTGQTQQFTATVTDETQRAVTDRRVVWSSSAPTVLSVDSLTGLATALSTSPAASATVTARVATLPDSPLGDKTDAVGATVLAPTDTVRVISGFLATSTLTIHAGAKASVTYAAYSPRGAALSGRTFSVTSSDEAVVTTANREETNTGIITAGSTAGTATLTIQALDLTGNAQGKPAKLTVTVTSP